MPATVVEVVVPPASVVDVVNENQTVAITAPPAQSIQITSLTAYVVSLNAVGPQGPPGISSIRTMHSFVVGGAIVIPSGDTGVIPPFFFSKVTAQTATLIKVVHKLGSGTSATWRLLKNGVAINGLSSVSSTTTKTSTSPGATTTFAEEDEIQVEVTAINGSPKNLTISIVVEHTV